MQIGPQLKNIVHNNYKSIVKYKNSNRTYIDIYDAEYMRNRRSETR